MSQFYLFIIIKKILIAGKNFFFKWQGNTNKSHTCCSAESISLIAWNGLSNTRVSIIVTLSIGLSSVSTLTRSILSSVSKPPTSLVKKMKEEENEIKWNKKAKQKY